MAEKTYAHHDRNGVISFSQCDDDDALSFIMFFRDWLAGGDPGYLARQYNIKAAYDRAYKITNTVH